MNWRMHGLDNGLGDWTESWDALNQVLYNAHPLYDSRFVSALLRHFGTGGERLLVHSSGADIDGMMILSRARRGVYRTFLPAQAQVCPVLVNSTALLDDVFHSLQPVTLAVDLMCQDPLYSPFGDQARLVNAERCHHALTMNIALDGDFDGYWSSRSKNLRSNIRRYRHRLQKESLQENMVLLDEPRDLHDAVARYGVLESNGWKGRAGTAVAIDNLQGAFYSEVLKAFAASARGHVYEYYLNDALVASRLAISNTDMLVILKTTYDETYAKFAPGRLLLYRVIEQGFVRGNSKSVELYTNANQDQLSWATGSRNIDHFTLYRNGAVRSLHRLVHGVKRMFPRLERKQPSGTTEQ